MPFSIWEKYSKIKQIQDNNSIIQSYLSKVEVIIKEIMPRNNGEYNLIKNILDNLKISNEVKIYDIFEEKEKFFVVIDNNKKDLEIFDSLFSIQEIDIIKEGIIANKKILYLKKKY